MAHVTRSKWDDEWENVAVKQMAALKEKRDELFKATKAFQKAQKECQKAVKDQGKLLKDLGHDLEQLRSQKAIDAAEWAKRRKGILEQETTIKRVKFVLPIDASLPLRLMLGKVNLTLPVMDQRWQYKQEYEQFKLQVTYVIILVSVLALYYESPALDVFFFMLLGWYNASVTIRELILKANGSDIKLWWLIHHYSSIAVSVILLLWYTSTSSSEFITNFRAFTLYQGIVQVLQYRYQSATLYKKRALGESKLLDTTTDLPNRWSLSALVACLAVAYVWQLVLACISFNIGSEHGGWQAWSLFWLYAVMGIGNVCITSLVVFRKFFPESKSAARVAKTLNSVNK
eukprot:TRINITY_DN11652_c0_g1_i4.p2 TRINITY_DN11652_c0_g1~~TRINITY_DN11652_c0_g1_i4.p2  ORF type:complete len:344 (+),score=64.85 TRINITY_DN11652_c0_g1_i4:2329-3360(+)